MGNQFQITVCSPDEAFGFECIQAAIEEIQRIERLLTTFNEESQTCQINKAAGIEPVKVDDEVCQLIERSIRISSLTQGAFDITYGSMDKRFWNFDQDMVTFPTAAQAKKSVHLINYKNVVLDMENSTVFLKKKGMRIGFGGIGKGYAAEKAKAVLLKKGINSGIVNAAGDLTAFGFLPNGDPWRIGIANPDKPQDIFSSMAISNMAVATSGNYEKVAVINGREYSHTIDPRTGFPVHGIRSVTIISPNAEIADALATPVMVMGIETGLSMINQMIGVECVIIDQNNRLHASKNINLIKSK